MRFFLRACGVINSFIQAILAKLLDIALVCKALA